MRTILRLLRVALLVGVSAALVAATVVVIAPYGYQVANATDSVDEQIDLSALDRFAVRSYVYAADGSLLATLHGAENRMPVTLDKIPKPVVDAIVAVEDADFYQHPGVNLRGTFRALLENVASGDIEQGGSTITQQLVKIALLDPKQDLDRKTKEAALALRLEKQLTKDQILEKYLNTVYFGSGAYGVQAAAETYWGVSVDQLGPAEGALLAALVNNPVRNDPTLNPKNARRQRQLALDRMVTLGMISPADAERYDRVALPQFRCGTQNADPRLCNGQLPPPPEDYFAEEVRQRLLTDPQFGLGRTAEERFSTLYGGGLKVYTTLDPRAQQQALSARDEIVPKTDFGLTAAMVSIEPQSGAVRAMVGGPGFSNFQYNITTKAPGRQTGSSFKTFVLLTALEQGAVPSDYVGGGGDFPNPQGTPNPYRVAGPGGTLDSVTTMSSNGAFVRLGQTVGLENVVDQARKLGVTGTLQPVISMPLGVEELTPIEMASAYSAIPNGGIHQPYYMVDRIEDRSGQLIYQHEANGTRAVSAQTACLATDILKHNVEYGTGRRAGLPRQVAAGKTGTTDQGADVWFVGFTPYLATAVWMGVPDSNQPLPAIDGVANMGGFFPARIWQAFNQAYHEDRPPVPFPNCGPQRPGRTFGDGAGSPPVEESNDGGNQYQAPATTAPPRNRSTTTSEAAPSTTAKPAPSSSVAPTSSVPPTSSPGGGGGGTP